jgi:hypothetical protein
MVLMLGLRAKKKTWDSTLRSCATSCSIVKAHGLKASKILSIDRYAIKHGVSLRFVLLTVVLFPVLLKLQGVCLSG